MRAHRLVLATIALAWLAGCVSASPVVSPSGAAESIPPAACPQIALLTPAGARLELTGRWRSPDGGTYYLRQSGSCIWFIGLSSNTPAPGGEGVSDWTNSFFGTLSSDFTFHGSWADVPWGDENGVGELTWRVDFSEVGGTEVVTLDVADVSGGFGGQFLVRPEGSEDLVTRLNGVDECVDVVTDTGEHYEVVTLPPGWSVAQPASLFGPNDEVIRTSDAFRISGEVARGRGFCGPGLLIFGDELETG